ncbi:2-dehydropantoate 2-reductase [Nitzschia inconspicua]|uniref:2-dehydropantoate 2-reductase n=1 Tax=Nitzschia inconspicua TaxID=303405 RepID=A0A9K3Q6D1_9STRA|nr:2-dehydropantoate 2-reductase [Nitzschia inconspicua]
MKILILGAGAVGGYFGGRLVEHLQQHEEVDLEVTFLVRSERAQQIRNDGLMLQNPDGSITKISSVATVLSDDAPSEKEELRCEFDVIVLACKSYGLDGALDAITPYAHSNVALLPLLNGMAHMEMIQHRFPSATVWGGTCGIVATLDSDTGVIQRMTPSQFVRAGLVEHKKSENEEAKAVVVTLMRHWKDAGIDAEVSDDILQTMWDKWTFLATAAASTCLMSASLGQILSTDYGQEFLLAVYQECNAVATADGGIQADLDGRQARYRHIFSDKTSIIKASMCRDMESGGPTEADHILGDMIQRATKHGIPTPLIKTAYIKLQIHEAQRQVATTGTNDK